MRVSRSNKRLKVPDFNKNLAYLCGYHLGDGYLEDVSKTFLRKGRGSYNLTYGDSDLDQIKIIDSILLEEFGCHLKIDYSLNYNMWFVKIDSCKVLHWFMNRKLGLPVEKKSKIEIPSWILKHESFITNFISGFFDAEGNVGLTKAYKQEVIRIQVTQKDLNILQEIKALLSSNYRIKSNVHKKWKQEAFTLKITARNSVEEFKRKINFKSPAKRKKLEILTATIIYKQPRLLK